MAKFYKDLILKYFKAVDDQDLDSILATLHPNCSFSVETHGVKLIEQKEIAQMFHRLWRNHKSVKHENFYFVDDAPNGSIAVRFNVVNELKDGTLVFKSNCNCKESKNQIRGDSQFSKMSFISMSIVKISHLL